MLNKINDSLRNDMIKMTLLFILGLLGVFSGRTEAAADDLIRVHIFANSDSSYDQQVKLIVRDAVMEYIDGLLEQASTAAETETAIKKHLPEIDALADGVAANYGYSAETAYGVFGFSERVWQGSVMPAGNYKALRILLGAGGGHNWFCVLYPELSFGESLGELEREPETSENQSSEDNADTDLSENGKRSESDERQTVGDNNVKIRLGSFFSRFF